MSYISASPFVFQVLIGLSSAQYGALFGVNAAGLVAVSAIAVRLARRHSIHKLLGIGLRIVLGSAVLLLILTVLGLPSWLLVIPFFIADASLGLELGNATALALGSMPGAAGIGSAVLGAAQFGLAAVITRLVSVAGPRSSLPVAICMTALAGIAYVSYAVAGSRSRPR